MRFFTFIFSIALLCPLFSYGQTQNENYIQSTVYQVETTTGNNVAEDDKIESITYYDGLGRPKQTIARRAGGDKEDLITPIEYDDFGRQPKEYLPYPDLNNNGQYHQNVVGPLQDFYENEFPEDINGLVPNPYSEKRFESSPLNRVLEQGAPGFDWRVTSNDSDHTIKFEYDANQQGNIYRFNVGFTNGDTKNPYLEFDGWFSNGNLYKTTTKNENWKPGDGWNNTTEEFKNKTGQVILKRTFNWRGGSQKILNTYYVYDDFGNLTYVLSPNASDLIVDNGDLSNNHQTEVLDKLSYQYKYDERNRLIWKKIPGKGHEKIVYDKLDRPILTQDANLRAKGEGEWLFTKYDAFGRVAYTGIYTWPSVIGIPLQEEVNTASSTVYNEEQLSSNPTNIDGTDIYYTNDAYPSDPDDLTVLTINYYDDYVDYTGLTLLTAVMGEPTTENSSVNTTTQGLPTVSKVRLLGTDQWTTTLTAYDKKGRALYTDSYNEYLDTRDIIKNKLDFTGKPTETVTNHQKDNDPTITTRDYFSYDHMGRMTNHLQQIDDEPMQLIAGNSYDELGQLVSKKVGGELFESGYTALEKTSVNTSSGEHIITKDNTAADTWNAGIATKGELDDDGGISFEVVDGGDYFVVGFNDLNNEIDPNSNDPDLAEIDFAFQFKQNGLGGNIFLIRENNSPVPGTNSSYQEGDVFAMEVQGSSLVYLHNGTAIRSTPIGSNIRLVGDACFKTPGAKIKNLTLYATAINKYLQNVNYAYNVRGWLTDINDVDGSARNNDLFNFRINYNRYEGFADIYGVPEGDPNVITEQFQAYQNNTGEDQLVLYNGNIAQTIWRTDNDYKEKVSYKYFYDYLNRLRMGRMRHGEDLDETPYQKIFNVWNIGYDKNGNLKQLFRSGTSQYYDVLTYNYDGNQLLGVVDNPPGSWAYSTEGFKDDPNHNNLDYSYDANGNLTRDDNKGITFIGYNHLNLPTEIEFENNPNKKIVYIYDATGMKLEKMVHEPLKSDKTTQYAGNYIYQDDELQFFNHTEGYVMPVAGTEGSVKGFDKGDGAETNSAYSYVFQYKDHLGNVRLSYSDTDLNGAIDPTDEIIEESNYYPFGLKHKGYNTDVSPNGNSTAQQYGFNGKEEQNELGLNYLDFGARNYDPALGRWMNIDPLAEQMRRYSPYNFAFDNPVFFIDPDGMKPRVFDQIDEENSFEFIPNKPQYITSTVVNNKGEVIDHKDDGDSNIYLNSRNGLIIGREKENKEYRIGQLLTANEIDEDTRRFLPKEFVLTIFRDPNKKVHYFELPWYFGGLNSSFKLSYIFKWWKSGKDAVSATKAAQQMGGSLVKEYKKILDTGARSGEHGNAFIKAGQELIRKANDKSAGYLPEFVKALKTQGKRLIEKGKSINHKM